MLTDTLIGKVARGHRYERLKEEQLFAVKKFVSGEDVLASLPTAAGFGRLLNL